MADLHHRQQQRSEFLMVLYELSDGDRNSSFTLDRIVPQLRSAAMGDEVQPVADWLRDNGLIDIRSLAGDYHLTPAGVNEAERLIEAAETARRTSGAVIDVDTVEDTVPLGAAEIQALQELVAGYRRAKARGELGLSDADEADADVLISTVKAQIESPKPRRRIVMAALEELKHLTRNMVASGAVIGLLELVSTVSG